jgi:arginyl-tRNA synthetase
LLEASGNSVIRANYQGDVGLHIAKTLWEIRKKLSKSPEARKTIDSLDTHGKIALIGKAYAAGNAAYETDEKAKQEIIEVNKMIYNNDPEIMPLYEETRQWSLDYFEEIYSLVDTKYDVYYFESQMAKRAVEIINDGVTKGIFEKNDGAIILNGEKHGVDTRVFLNQIGLPTYEGKDMALAEKEFNDFGTLDQNIHTVAGEQTSFFKTLFKAQELYFGYTKGKQKHQVYGWVDVKGQKMSSRKGNVVEGEWLINEAKKQILESFEKTDESVAAQLAMASIKYIFLKAGLQNKIDVDLNEAVSINGNSAPYLLYTYVRTKSILAKKTPTYSINQDTEINENELQLLRELIKYPEVVHDATKNVSPHLIATYLFNLAQSFNLFYQKNPILKAEAEIKELRLLITQATSNIIKDGLRLLGIQTVEKM